MLLDPINPALPACPAELRDKLHIAYPSLTLVFILLSVLCFVFGLVAYLKYNTVKVFKRVIRRDEISNTYWVVFFASSFFKNALFAAKYATGFDNNDLITQIFGLAVAVGHAICAFCLSLALLHQFRWRTQSRLAADPTGSFNYGSINTGPRTPTPTLQHSGSDSKPNSVASKGGHVRIASDPEAPLLSQDDVRSFRAPPAPIASTVYVSETTSFFTGNSSMTWKQWLKHLALSWESCFLLLLVIFVVFIFVTAEIDDVWLLYVTAAVYVAQRVPSFILAGIVCLNHISTSFDSVTSVGPTFGSRLLLFFGTLFTMVMEVPVDAWSRAFSQYGCFMKVASGVDLMFLSGIISYVLFFVLLTREFKRNVNACLWGTALQTVCGYGKQNEHFQRRSSAFAINNVFYIACHQDCRGKEREEGHQC